MKQTIALGVAVAALAVAMASVSMEAMGNETVNFTYDGQGRLTRVQHAGGINSNQQANYTYDDADNRLTRNVTGAP